MCNTDWMEYIEKKPFEDKLRALCESVERATRYEIDGCIGTPGSRDYYRKESKHQWERVNTLFKHLIIEDEERKIRLDTPTDDLITRIRSGSGLEPLDC